MYGFSVLSGKMVETGGALGFSNKWAGFAVVLLGIVAFILLLGLIAEKTSFIDFLRNISARKPTLLLLTNFIFGRKGASNNFYEVICSFSDTVRVRGIVTAEIEEGGTVWCVTHFSAPPTPFMGNLLEIRKDILIPTGNGSGAYVAYVMSYGSSQSAARAQK